MGQQRVAVVTGASAGIGEAIVRSFAAQGIACVVNARRAERLEELASELNRSGRLVAVCAGDAADKNVVERIFECALTNFKRNPDLVVANAGRGLAGSVLTSEESEWDEMIRINLVGLLYLVRHGAKLMLEDLEGGRGTATAHDIVILGSTVGRHISPYSSVYGATKFAVNSLAEALRRELAPKNIRVTLLEPGIVESEFQGVAGYDAKWFSQYAEKWGPLLVPDDIARAVSFIVSQPAHVSINDVVIRATRQDYP